MNKHKKEALLHLSDQLNKCLFDFERKLEDDIDVKTNKWKEYYIKISDIHKTLWTLQDEIENF